MGFHIIVYPNSRSSFINISQLTKGRSFPTVSKVTGLLTVPQLLHNKTNCTPLKSVADS